MSPRFVEILDVGAEANSLFRSMAVATSGVASELQHNLTRYINATANTVDSRLVSVLESYNVSKDDVYEAIAMLNLQVVNSTIAKTVERPKPISAMLMGVGSFLIVVHLLLVHVESRKLVREYGNYNTFEKVD